MSRLSKVATIMLEGFSLIGISYEGTKDRGWAGVRSQKLISANGKKIVHIPSRPARYGFVALAIRKHDIPTRQATMTAASVPPARITAIPLQYIQRIPVA